MLMATLELLPSIHLRAIALAVFGRSLDRQELELQFLGPLKHTVALSLRLPRNIPGPVSMVKEPPPLAPPAYLQAMSMAGRPPQLPLECIVDMTPMRTLARLFLTLRLFPVPALAPAELLAPVLPLVLVDEDRDASAFATLLSVPSVVDRTVKATMTVNIDSIVVITDKVPLCPPFWNAFMTVMTVNIVLMSLKTVVTPPTTGTKSSIKLSVLNVIFMTLYIAAFRGVGDGTTGVGSTLPGVIGLLPGTGVPPNLSTTPPPSSEAAGISLSSWDWSCLWHRMKAYLRSYPGVCGPCYYV